MKCFEALIFAGLCVFGHTAATAAVTLPTAATTAVTLQCEVTEIAEHGSSVTRPSLQFEVGSRSGTNVLEFAVYDDKVTAQSALVLASGKYTHAIGQVCVDRVCSRQGALVIYPKNGAQGDETRIFCAVAATEH